LDPNVVISINAPIVVSETRDGESIIMHHGTGTFFDSSGSGARIWQWIEQGSTLAAIAVALVACYDTDHAAAFAAAKRFVEVLTMHDLVQFGGVAAAAPALAMEAAGREPLPEPVLGVHTDLADMLLLDPIHDVDEAGWPVAPA
jgi:hypothetical protein